MKANCNDCGKPLKTIDYVMPAKHGGKLYNRPPLCKSCWAKEIDKIYGREQGKKLREVL